MDSNLFDKLITNGYSVEDALFAICDCTSISVCGNYEKSTCLYLLLSIYRTAGYSVYLYDSQTVSKVREDFQAQGNFDIIIVKLSYETLKKGLHNNAQFSIITNIIPYPIEKGTAYYDLINIFAESYIHQKTSDCLILNHDYHFLHSVLPKIPGTLLEFSPRQKITEGIGVHNKKIYCCHSQTSSVIMDTTDFILPGIRKKDGYLSAICAAYPFVDTNILCKAVREFRGAPNHYELVRELYFVKYYNNAASYLPSHTVQSFQPYTKKVILITGSSLTDFSYSSLAMEIIAFIKILIVYGESAEKIIFETKKAAFYDSNEIQIYKVDSIQDAVKQARQSSSSNDIVIFSPCGGDGSAASIAGLGEEFRKSVNALK